MPPRASKPSPAPAAAATAAKETRKTADALWLFEQLLNCDPPVILNVTPISEATGMKPNTIVKRINTMQHRYPGFGIITRTTGARQSSNLVTGTPVTPVKKAAGKGAGTGSKSKKVRIVEEDSEDDGKRQTRGKKCTERGISAIEIKTDEEGDQTQASTDDEDGDEPSTPSIKKLSKKTKPQKKGTSKRPPPDSSDDNADDSELTEVEEDPPAKKIATPKTRGGRKSAGIGEIKDLRAYPEKPVPRGRHAISKKEKVQDAKVMKDDTVEFDAETALEKGAGDVPNGNKRKRSETAESQSSSLTPSPAIKQRLAEMDNTKQSKKEGSHANQLSSSSMPPPFKIRKKNPDTKGDNIDAGTMIQEACQSAATPETPEDHPVPTKSQEETGAKVEGAQSVTEAALDVDPDTAAEPEQDVDRIMTTPLGQNIDEIPDASTEAGDSGELAAEKDQVMEAPESPTAGRGAPVKPAIETVPNITAVPVLEATVSKVTEAMLDVIGEVERLPEATGNDVQAPSSAPPPDNIENTTTEDTNTQEPPIEATKREAPKNIENPIVPKPKRSVRTERSPDAKESGQSKSKSQFSQPLEWMIWNPTAKPSKSEYAPKVGRVLP